MQKKISIFVSGNGSNAEVLYKYFRKNAFIEIVSIISNNKNAGILERGASWKTPIIYCSNADFDNGHVTKLLEREGIDFIILAGFLKKVPETLTRIYKNRILNIHPALLPKYGGKGMYGMNVHQAVRENHEPFSGITIHLVDAEFDNGKILFQQSCKINNTDTVDDIASKVQKLEHLHYAPLIEKYITNYQNYQQ